jgi:hypothetical protein
MTDRAWIILAALCATASVILYVCREMVAPIWHHFKLRDPIDLHFVVTKREWAALSYVEQNDSEHRTKDLVYPSHTTDLYLQLQYFIKTSFKQTHLAVHFWAIKTSARILRNGIFTSLSVAGRKKHQRLMKLITSIIIEFII